MVLVEVGAELALEPVDPALDFHREVDRDPKVEAEAPVGHEAVLAREADARRSKLGRE